MASPKLKDAAPNPNNGGDRLGFRFMPLHDVLLFAIANYGIYTIDFSLDSR
jgi:hypothetical protein